MWIDAITTCVGEKYSDALIEALPVWWNTLNSLTIVSKPDGNSKLRNAIYAYQPEFKLIEANVFGQYFNKGRALNTAFNHTDPTDWVLSFDCDILPPENWRDIAELRADASKLNGARRYNKDQRLDSTKFFAKGYFQLWHRGCPFFKQRPPFIEWCEHAGRCDTIFAEQWPIEMHNELGFKLRHQGERSKNWFGPETTPEQMRSAIQDATKDRRE